MICLDYVELLGHLCFMQLNVRTLLNVNDSHLCWSQPLHLDVFDRAKSLFRLSQNQDEKGISSTQNRYYAVMHKYELKFQ